MIYNYSTNLGETILGGNDMSIVRYVNKKTGTVTLYESTSHYDAATKQSRPSRKYLGREDPITKELIPSTGKRGRKKEENSTSSVKNQKELPDYKMMYLKTQQELCDKEKEYKALQNENRRLRSYCQRMYSLISEIMSSLEQEPPH